MPPESDTTPTRYRVGVVHHPELNEKRRRILMRVAYGDDNTMIGAMLHLSPDTIKGHMRWLFQWRGVRNRTELLAELIAASIIILKKEDQ